MAFIYITEYADVAVTHSKYAQAGAEPAIAEQRVANDGASAQSAAFNDNTRMVRIHTDSICSIKFGANPTAVTTEKRMAANTTEFFGVKPGQKVAAVLNT